METEDLDVNSWRQTVEQVIYPAAKQILNPPKICSEDMTFVQVANLPDLYKVFERC
jgi:DNA mismatch repair protein MLH1